MATLAPSLVTLRNQFNKKYPNRDKSSDGWIGDPAHQARVSDHNADEQGIVRALDITHDPKHGVDTWAIADIILLHQDPRLSFVISNGRIGSGPSGTKPGVWRKYTGQNSHAHHVHVSVVKGAIADSTNLWVIDGVTTTPAPMPPKPKGITEDMRKRMMEKILSYEGRFDRDGHIQVYIAPDGNPEIGGITQKDHPEIYPSLKKLLDMKLYDRLRQQVLKYYDDYTDQAQNWTDRAGLEFYLRDCILNRGPTGAAKILQRAVGVTVDGEVGPTTRGALAALNVEEALARLRVARENYEWSTYGKEFRESRGQVQGLKNRWDKAVSDARMFQKEQGQTTPLTKTLTGTGVGGGAAVVTGWFTDNLWIIAGVAVVITALVIFAMVKAKK